MQHLVRTGLLAAAGLHKCQDESCSMAHVGNAMRCDPRNGWLLAIPSIVREKYIRSCGHDKANARE